MGNPSTGAFVDLQEQRMLNKINFSAKAGVRQAANELAQALRDVVNRRPRSGRKYRDLPNRSSAPGEPPKTQSGDLVDSIYVSTSGSGARLTATVFIGADSAPELEYGTERISPRPFVRPTFNKQQRRIRNTVASRVFAEFGI